MTQNRLVQQIWTTGLLVCATSAGVQPAVAQQEAGAQAVPVFDSVLQPPQTFEDFWRALDRDLKFGRWDRAKAHLQALLQHPDITPELVMSMREKYGSAMLLKLQNSEQTRDQAQQLITLANEAALAKAKDAERILHFLDQLSKSPGERAFAIDQLRRSGSYAIPYFIQVLQASPQDQIPLTSGLLAMNTSSWPAVAAATRSNDEKIADLMVTVLDKFQVPESAESLWYLSASPTASTTLQAHAKQVLAKLLGVPAGNLPPASAALAKIAEDYYQHRSQLSRLSGMQDVWEWTANGLEVTQMSVEDAEEWVGIRRAREALELTPGLHEARVTLVSLALQRSFERIGIDQQLPGTREGVQELVLAAGPDLLAEVLKKAIRERRTAVALGAVRSLGRTGNRSLLFGSRGPGILAQALDYPSARVQTAATFAALNIHSREPFPRSARVVHTLVRSLARDTRPGALIVDPNTERANQLGGVLTQIGYVPSIAATGREAFEAAANSASVDLIIIEPTIRNWGLDETLINLRADPRTAGVPIVLTARPEIEGKLQSLTNRFAGVIVVQEAPSKEYLEAALGTEFNDPMEAPLTPSEKAANQRKALDWIVRVARGEFAGMSAEPATGPLLALLASQELGPTAAEALGYLPSAEVQQELAKIVVSEVQTLPLRLAAADALARNIQRGGSALTAEATQQLQNSLATAEDQQLRLAVAQVVGAAGPSGEVVAQKLQTFQPLTDADVDRAGMVPQTEKPAEPPAEPKPEEPPAENTAEQPKPAAPSFFDQ